MSLDGESALSSSMSNKNKADLMEKAYNAIILCLGDKVLQEISKEKMAVGVWSKLGECLHDKAIYE